jgi:hypothetical protein
MGENRNIKYYKYAPPIEEVKCELTPIPGFDPNYVLAHCPSGHIWNVKKQKWLLQGSKGVGNRLSNGEGAYLMTKLMNLNGELSHYYIHYLIYASFMGFWTVEEMIAMGWEINHENRWHPFNTRINSISNLTQADRLSQYTDDVIEDMRQPKGRLTVEDVKQIRKDFVNRSCKKMDFYFNESIKFGCKYRCIQNVCLGTSFKNIEA